MLYIFHVDTGTTITFDIKLAMQSVADLKEAIERECGVVAQHQVLLMSGGESLEPHARVYNYSAGTDTNPIYLFSKAAIENHVPPTPSIDYGSDVDLNCQIDASLQLPATFHTLAARATLAQQCCGLAREQLRICERLVHDQHLQQQGWAAVVANLEDITLNFQQRADNLQQSFSLYLAERPQHMELLQNFNADLQTLEKIPILPALRAQAEGLLSPDEQPSNEVLPSGDGDEVLSLLKWISAKDNQSSLEQVAEQCSRGLEQFDERVMESLKAEVSVAVDTANKQDMKEIKGLGERLFSLEQLMLQMKKLVQEQGELAQGFQQNQNRVTVLGDESVLPDLCNSHRKQLMVMLQNHNQLRDIRRRCTKAKEELSMNIYYRLKWIMYVENKMIEVNGKLVMYHESLRRLRRHLEVLQQIHLAPQMYVSAIAEVVRRRTFSQAFLVWASTLACQLLTVHSEEIAKRREFGSKFEGHFLNTLFPGLEDTPPPYATQAPSVFDNGLPKLTVDDMESLREQLPDLALSLSTPDLNSITQFFFSKSLTEGSSDGNKDKDSSSMRVDPPTKEQEQIRPLLMGERAGFESETDTEEFEKISQAATDSKLVSFEASQQRQKQLEVGASQNASLASSTSTNASPLNSRGVDLNRSSSSSSDHGSFHFPSLSTSERQGPQLSPLAECAENVDCAPEISSKSEVSSSSLCPLTNPTFPSQIHNTCDGQQQRLQSGSGGSSPSVGNAGTDFMGTEFYMDESLPSSLSEHPTDSQHQAIVSLLQENLGNTRDELERLRSVIKNMKSVASDALAAFREELNVLRNDSVGDRNEFTAMTDRIKDALKVHSSECERTLREREQVLTVDHELELADLKKLLQSRDEEVRVLKRTIAEIEVQSLEHEHLIRAMRQKLEDKTEEMKSAQVRHDQHLEDTLMKARIDIEGSFKAMYAAKLMSANSLSGSLHRCRERICELEEELAKAGLDKERAIKEATDKLQVEYDCYYKAQLDTLRRRFKLMAASTMERSPSDSSLEKIERADVIEFGHQGPISPQAKGDNKPTEKDAEIGVANDEDKAAMKEKLKLAERMIEEKEREVKLYQQREAALLEECQHYEASIVLFTERESKIRSNFDEKMESLEQSNARLEDKISANEKLMEQKDSRVHDLEVERNELRQELNDERLKMSQTSLEGGRLKDLDGESDEARASESKKVRLEADNDPTCLARRLESLESDNKRLASELRSTWEGKKTAEAKVEILKAEKTRLEVELLKERSRKMLIGESMTSSSSSGFVENRDKDMSASVALVPYSSSGRYAATSPQPCKKDFTSSACACEPSTSSSVTEPSLALSKHLRDKIGRISISKCTMGDTVIVLWDQVHRNYVLMQDSPTFHFLTSDCIDTMDLRLGSDGLPRKTHVFAEVVEKEYCQAKKPENRYRVPLGTKFYRVRVKPLRRHVGLATSEIQ